MTSNQVRVDCDLAIVGAGPVGLYAAYYAGFRGLSAAVIDSLPEPGGQISAMYPEKPIYDVAGFPMVKGRDLVAGLVQQAAPFDPVYLLGHQAQTLTVSQRVGSEQGLMELRTDLATVIAARAVLVSGGIGTFTPRQLPTGMQWLGRGLAFFVPTLQAYADLDVVVIGGGDSACDWALSLAPIARSVTLVHRRAAFRAHAFTVAQLRESTVRILTDAQVSALDGAERVEWVEVTDPAGLHRLPAQAVIAALGFVANLGPIKSWGVELVDNRHIQVDTRMASSVPGVYAAGDIADYPGKVRLISVGFGEAATAVNNAAVQINPEQHLFPGHSSAAEPVPVS